METDRHWFESSLVHDNRLCHTLRQTCPGYVQKRKLRRAAQTGTTHSNGSHTVGLEIDHDRLDTRVGRARCIVPRIILSHNVSGSLTIPCGSSRICDSDWLGQSPFAPQLAALVTFLFLACSVSQCTCRRLFERMSFRKLCGGWLFEIGPVRLAVTKASWAGSTQSPYARPWRSYPRSSRIAVRFCPTRYQAAPS